MNNKIKSFNHKKNRSVLEEKILFGINGLDILCEQLRYLACPGGDEIDSNWDLKSLGQ